MSEKILLVDDEPHVLEGWKRQLRNKLVVETATSGRDGLALLGTAGPFAVVVSDMRMPGMDGAAFLEQVRKQSPDTVRMILSGQAELSSTIAAVNLGQIFRFLTKPCARDELFAALEAALEQYRLIIARRELLEQTLRGTVQVLTEILGLTNPSAHRRASRIERRVRDLCAALGVPMQWQLQLATMLSQIGCITLPEEILSRIYAGQALSDEASAIYASHPRLAGRLLGGIPRLETVAAIVARQLEDFDCSGLPDDVADWDVETLGAVIIRLATDLDNLSSSGMPRDRIVPALMRGKRELPARLRAALESLDLGAAKAEKLMVNIAGLHVGMVLDQDLLSASGIRLVPKGQEITSSILVRLRSIAERVGVAEPIRVNVAA